ncbi:MAG: transposase [Nitrospira sp.]|nr:MAG: transposase [Nitrospira sp.]
MIDRTHALPVVRQCQLLGLSRSTAYYQPTPVSGAELALMRRIDELHLTYPFAGARMLRDLLRRDGHAIGRRHVATLMRRMGLAAVYRKPHLSQRHPAHTVYPYLLRDLEIIHPNHVWGEALGIEAEDLDRKGEAHAARFDQGRELRPGIDGGEPGHAGRIVRKIEPGAQADLQHGAGRAGERLTALPLKFLLPHDPFHEMGKDVVGIPSHTQPPV